MNTITMNGCTVAHCHFDVITQIRDSLKLPWCVQIMPIWRDANQRADALDVLGLEYRKACLDGSTPGVWNLFDQGTNKGQATLELFHMHGPRSPLSQDNPTTTPSLSEVLSYDQSKVDSKLFSATENDHRCFANACVYAILYGEKSFSAGFFSNDTISQTSTDVFPNFLFGCGQYNQGNFENTARLLGLGRDPLSLVSQTAQKYGNFSYCPPSLSSSTRHLTLGDGGASTTTKFTPFASSRDHTTTLTSSQ
ncbi:hypothetical protein BUALT_Bualt18G0067600 [Buddleja alternifolia]|uniref:Xylanase inhibitor N-terminal domain-containing protein n=1 Tax=Buddleja alternifolia TaxID=168488 RepID=A0AAV6WB03_9LAMI|nr:hypothetical protein BUALT_Bualt18G0067600 [Buddleja alternifolia]